MGHIAGVYLPGDIYVKFLRLKGKECLFICGTDEHGVPITITADQEGKSPAEVVEGYHRLQDEAFKGLGIEMDIFSGTSTCPYHEAFSQDFFMSLFRAGHVEPRVTAQYFCTQCNRFLPDRYVEGSCPYCGSPDARGDQCEACGNTLDALKDPRCKECGRRPEHRKTKHWFFRLDKYEERLKDWLGAKSHWKENVRPFALGIVEKGLKPRSITRDLVWGVSVPVDEAKGKVLYVWFDAPIGYISFTRELAEQRSDPDLWKRYWRDKETKLVHFIGKDNIVFHAVIWPAMLMGQKEEYILPAEIPAFEYLHYRGGKFSKSKRRALWVHDYLKNYPADLARYYLTAIAPETRDTQWLWQDFVARVNADLADILGNFVNRTLTFVQKYFEGRVPDVAGSGISEMLEAVKSAKGKMDENLEGFRFREALKAVTDLARDGNRIFDKREPWARRKNDAPHAAVTLRGCLEIVQALTVLGWPFLPNTCARIRSWLGLSEKPALPDWEGLGRPALEGKAPIGTPEILFEKLDLSAVLEMEGESPAEPEPRKEAPLPSKKTVPFKTFQSLDLRIGKILSAEKVEGADKLLRMEVDIGDAKRTMVAGIAQHYPDVAALVGRSLVVVTNLEPAKIRGIESTAMLLAGQHGDDVVLVVPEKDLPPGSEVS
jgi:methionyl-tRNA synthetase